MSAPAPGESGQHRPGSEPLRHNLSEEFATVEGAVGGSDASVESSGADKRRLHSMSEQRRRNSIKSGYEDLAELIGLTEDPSTGKKPAKAAVLQSAIGHVEALLSERDQQEKELQAMRKKVQAANMINEHYRQSIGAGNSAVSDQAKLAVFQAVMEQLALSFNNSVDTGSFERLLKTVMDWVDRHCDAKSLAQLSQEALNRVVSEQLCKTEQPSVTFM